MGTKQYIYPFVIRFNEAWNEAELSGVRVRTAKDGLSVRITRQYRSKGMAWFNSVKVYLWNKEDVLHYTARFSRPPGTDPITTPMLEDAMIARVLEWLQK